MKIVESYLTENRCYKNASPLTVRGLMLHSVGCAQPSAAVFAKNWNVYNAPGSGVTNKCTHGMIDGNSGDFYQFLPFDWKGDHAGKGATVDGVVQSANGTHIGIEMCEPGKDVMTYVSGTKVSFTNQKAAEAIVARTYATAVEVYAMLCRKYGLDETAIISHREGHALGIASNHGDPEHLWSQTSLGYTMNTFRAAVKAKLKESQTVMQPYIDSCVGYVVALEAGDTLNVRIGPGTSFANLDAYPRLGSGNGFEICGTDQSRKWLYICIAGKYYGWVNRAYVKLNY